MTGTPDRRSVAGPGGLAGLAELLADHRPWTATEAADLARARSVATTGDPWHRGTPLHLTASALIVHPPTRRVLLRWHARQRAWLQVGGHADPGENVPLAIALREGEEETGLPDLAPWPDPALLHVVVVPVSPGGDEPAHEHADLRFVLATQQPELARPERSGATVRWLSLDQAREATAEANLRESLSRVASLFSRAGAGNPAE